VFSIAGTIGNESSPIHKIITGLVTHGCIRATCLGALELGFHTILVSDGHSSFSKDAPRLIEKWNRNLAEKGAELISAGEVIF